MTSSLCWALLKILLLNDNLPKYATANACCQNDGRFLQLRSHRTDVWDFVFYLEKKIWWNVARPCLYYILRTRIQSPHRLVPTWSCLAKFATCQCLSHLRKLARDLRSRVSSEWMWRGRGGTQRFVFIRSSLKGANEITPRSLSKWWSHYEMVLSLGRKKKKPRKRRKNSPEGVDHRSVTPHPTPPPSWTVKVTSSSCSPRSSRSAPRRMKEHALSFKSENTSSHSGERGKIKLPCLTNISYHKICSFPRTCSHDKQINNSDGNQTLRRNICNLAFFFPSSVPLFFCSAHHFSGPWICSNHQHGSVGWQEDAGKIVPKELGADLHITPDQHVAACRHTRCLSLPCFVFFASLSVFFFFSSCCSLLYRTVCLHPNENLKERLFIPGRPGQG